MVRVAIAAVILTLIAGSAPAAIRATALRCEYLPDPLGIDTPHPRLSWIIDGDGRDITQTAYQIEVKSGGAVLWDSGRVASPASSQIAYAGPDLTPGQAVTWRVRVWDANNDPSPWSDPARWERGISDWHGQWIGSGEQGDQPAPLMRKPFTLAPNIKRARAYVCGLGYYQLRLNGKKVGRRQLDPPLTNYDKRALYATYDVTQQVASGQNVLGLVLGAGWYDVHQTDVWHWEQAPWRGAPRGIVELLIDYDDGHTQRVVSDGSWKWAPGPIVWNAIYGGEHYDARKQIAGWDRAGFDDSAWSPVKRMPPPKGELVAQQMPPIEVVQEIPAKNLTQPKPGVWLFDIGQNIAGVPQITLQGAQPGDPIDLRCGERLGPDGLLEQKQIDVFVKQFGGSFQQDQYICRGGGEETWRPRFTYHGFRWVELRGWPTSAGKPTLANLRGLAQHTAVPSAGSFSCSNDLLNKIQAATRWSYLNNLMSIPTDCPTREKNGWTGDADLAFETGAYNFHAPAFYTKWTNDIADDQRPAGDLSGIIPTPGWGYGPQIGPAWDSACILIPWQMYQYYADTRILSDHYDTMTRYLAYLGTRAQKYIVDEGLGDWAPYHAKTSPAITSTAYYYKDATVMAQIARLLGKNDDATKYDHLAADISTAFNARFYHPDSNTYGEGTQTALSCALYQGLVPHEHEDAVFANLVALIEKDHRHLDTGILGAKYVMNVLLDHGRADLGYAIASQKDLPSWGKWIQDGATTLYESWNDVDSRDHIMFGDISAWMFKALAGIRRASPGFDTVIIRPEIVGDLTSASATYDSIHGPISSAWTLDGAKVRLEVHIPPNTTATIYPPGKNPTETTGAAAQNGAFHLGSGRYVFVSDWTK